MHKTEDCATCGRTFRYDIAKVPRQYLKATNALQPLCLVCLHVVNQKRANCHQEPIDCPPGAYLEIEPMVAFDEDDYL